MNATNSNFSYRPFDKRVLGLFRDYANSLKVSTVLRSEGAESYILEAGGAITLNFNLGKITMRNFPLTSKLLREIM